jgi:hypothetical protein
MTIERFEDIQGWQQARKLTNMVFEVSEKDRFAKHYRLRDQIQGAAISSMANIAEGFDCETDAEFMRFFELCVSFCYGGTITLIHRYRPAFYYTRRI